MQSSISSPHHHLVLTLALTAALLLLASTRPAAAIETAGELTCQVGTSLALGSFVREKAQCIENCQKQAFVNETTPDCAPPYDGSLQGCVNAAEGGAGGEMQASCAQDCPECYTGGDCQADADQRVIDAEAHVDALAAEAFCDDSVSDDGLTLAEFKCQRTVRKTVTHFFAAKLRCFAKCRKGEIGGKIEAGSCAAPTDPKTLECIDRIETKTAFLIDKKCEISVNPSAGKPECAPYDTRSGADWVVEEEAEVDSWRASLFCNDPLPTTTTTTTLP